MAGTRTLAANLEPRLPAVGNAERRGLGPDERRHPSSQVPQIPIYLVELPLDGERHGPIGLVADPAGDDVPPRHIAGGGTKPDPLDVALKDDVAAYQGWRSMPGVRGG